MRAYQKIDPFKARELGVRRQRIHWRNSSPRFFKDRNEEDTVGAAAELGFSHYSGLPVDENLYVYGDGLVDFEIYIRGQRVTMDVKGARKPKNLFLKAEYAHKAADILILASVEGDDIWFLGWEHRWTMLLCPIEESKYGIVNHVRPNTHLRPMWQLIDLIEMSREQGNERPKAWQN